MKSRSKIALFSNERHFEIWFSRKKRFSFFWSKLSKLHKKDPILHVPTTFSLKQGETRTSHGPIPHPLTLSPLLNLYTVVVAICWWMWVPPTMEELFLYLRSVCVRWEAGWRSMVKLSIALSHGEHRMIPWLKEYGKFSIRKSTIDLTK